MMGNFQKVTKDCKACGGKDKTHEEKKTDVHLSVQMLRSAFLDEFDKLVLISGDSDEWRCIKPHFVDC